MKKRFLALILFCSVSTCLHAQTRRLPQGEVVKLEICDVINLNVVTEKQAIIKDTLVREVSYDQLDRIEEQLKQFKVCFWKQTSNGWIEFCSKESKKLNKVYVFLVKATPNYAYPNSENGTITSTAEKTVRRLVTGKMTEILGPPSME